MTNITASFDFFNNINLSIAKIAKFWSIELEMDLFFVTEHVVHGVIKNDSPDVIIARIKNNEEVFSLSEKIDVSYIYSIASNLTKDDVKEFYNPLSNICAGQLSSIHICHNCRMQMYIYPNQKIAICEHCKTPNDLTLSFNFNP